MARSSIHEIRHGLIKVRICSRPSSTGVRHTLSIVRLYRNGDVWKESTRFAREDIPLMQLTLFEAYQWMHAHSQRCIRQAPRPTAGTVQHQGANQ